MTTQDVALLKRCVDRIVAVELVGGEQFFAEILFVFDEGDTPDVFYLRCDREPDGAFVAANAGESTLLSEIQRVALIPGVAYPEG